MVHLKEKNLIKRQDKFIVSTRQLIKKKIKFVLSASQKDISAMIVNQIKQILKKKAIGFTKINLLQIIIIQKLKTMVTKIQIQKTKV